MSAVLYPCSIVLSFLGFKRVAWFTLAMFLIAMLLAYYADKVSLSIWMGLLCWWCLGLAWTEHQQLVKVKCAIRNVDTKNFDHRSLHLSGDVEADFIQQLMSTYRELGRENAHYLERNREVEYSALQVIDISSKVKSNVASQAEATDSTAASITEMSQSITEVNSQVSQTHRASCKASETAEHGRCSLLSLEHAVVEVTQQAHFSQDRMRQLNQLVKDVEKITVSIKQISQQTNLLALNASIEAARAGEFGRGFAVVAEEVRNLAERTYQSTDAIVSNIDDVLGQSSEIVKIMEMMVKSADVCHERFTEVNVAFDDIKTETDSVKHQMEALSCVSSQQAIATNEISEHISRVVLGAQSNSTIAEQTELVANHLRKLTQMA